MATISTEKKPVGLLVDALQVQKLIGQRRQTRNVLKHAPRVRAEGQRFQPRLKNRDRRAEFVRRIDKKPLVSLVALIKAAQRIIDRRYQRNDFGRHVLQRQPRATSVDIDFPGMRGSAIKAGKGSANHHGRCDKRCQRHQRNDGQDETQEQRQSRMADPLPGHCSALTRQNLDVAGRRVDPLHARRGAHPVKDVPAEPRLADAIEGIAYTSIFQRHPAL